ncbi:uncharacterized protein LOC100897720 [Galendromus occidentalis]|uniref:Uncharacterized protein LOC100897720 n=1 Tax=Galendromus occidentalis TaxID=34638 RepID=A0AAJ6QMG3_9ACAR|nr:uncharacterized protein LOC100897720 [Galendromus occidentalis]
MLAETTVPPPKSTGDERGEVDTAESSTQTPDILPRAPWLAGPGPIDCVVLRLADTELFAHSVTFCIHQHGIRTSDIVVAKKQDIGPRVDTLRRTRESIYAVTIDEKALEDNTIGVHFFLQNDNSPRILGHKEAVRQIAEDFAEVKDSPWNRQRIIRFFLDPMLDVIEPTLEEFNYFKNYLKKGLRG